jgi:hypothetical protein
MLSKFKNRSYGRGGRNNMLFIRKQSDVMTDLVNDDDGYDILG